MAKATTKPTSSTLLERNINRINTLKQAIAKAEAKGNDDRVASLQSELDRRTARIEDVKAMLAEADV
jgi:hypothetical protein